MAKNLKNIETFDEHKKRFSLSDVMAMLPTSKEAENYVNGYFGFPEDYDESMITSASEEGFVSGCDWMRSEIEQKLKAIKNNDTLSS
jgi:hypothetical protein